MNQYVSAPVAPRRRPTTGGSAGFTLMEMVVVVLLTSIVLGATYQVLVTNQRVYTAQTEQVTGQGTVRAGLGVLSAEFRELSAGGGDIVDMGPTQVEVRTMRGMGFVCRIESVNPLLHELYLRLAVGHWRPGAEVFVFADNDPGRSDDDVWLEGAITQVAVGEPCPDEPSGQPQRVRIRVMNLGQLGLSFNLIHLGAPVRSFETHRYGVLAFEGQPFLGRQTYVPLEGWDEWTPLVGPLAREDGLLLEYFDASGNQTTQPDQVRRIDIRLRTLSEARDLSQERVAQTITTSIYTRN